MLLATVLFSISCTYLSQAYSLPPAVLGSAIVAAVEQDTEQQFEQRLEHKWLEQAEQQFRKLLNNELSPEEVINMLDTWTAEGRGKHRKHKKMLKMLYPLLGAAVLAKLILLPLILKWLTALSASSFVMGKIALATAGLLAIKSMLSSGHSRDRLEIIHSSAPTYKSYQADLSASGSSWVPIRQPYIPIGISKDATIRVPTASKEMFKPFL